jgi:hypothetical protein
MTAKILDFLKAKNDQRTTSVSTEVLESRKDLHSSDITTDSGSSVVSPETSDDHRDAQTLGRYALKTKSSSSAESLKQIEERKKNNALVLKSYKIK